MPSDSALKRYTICTVDPEPITGMRGPQRHDALLVLPVQDPDQLIEAASLRVAPLEERHQAAMQASLAEAAKAEASNPVQQILRRHRARSSSAPGAAATHARTLQQPPGNDLRPSRPPGLMLPPPPRPASHLGQVSAGASATSCSSQGPTSQGLSLARLPSAPEDLPMAEAATSLDLPEAQLQLGKHTNGVEPMLLDAPPLIPSNTLASAPQRANSAAAAATAAAAALPTPPGLPSETAAVAAASDALIATFSAAGTSQAAAAPPPTADSISASAADSSELPHKRQGAQTEAAASNAAHLSQSQEQSGVTGIVSNSAQSEAGPEANGARQAGRGEQPGFEAEAAASGPAQSSPAFRAGGGAGFPQSMDLGSQGRAALAAMPQIGPDSDDEDVSCVNMRYRPRTAAPVKVQTKEQVAQQQKMSEEVKSKWLEGLQAAAKVRKQPHAGG